VPGAGTYPVTSSHPEEWASCGIVASITDASPHYTLLANSISHDGTPLGLVRVQVTTVEEIECATSRTNSTKGVCEAAEPLILPLSDVPFLSENGIVFDSGAKLLLASMIWAKNHL
jgi:hypothetical protein